MIITVEINGFKVNLEAPDHLTHLDRNWVESIEDCIAVAKAGPRPLPNSIVEVGELRRIPWFELPEYPEADNDRD